MFSHFAYAVMCLKCIQEKKKKKKKEKKRDIFMQNLAVSTTPDLSKVFACKLEPLGVI